VFWGAWVTPKISAGAKNPFVTHVEEKTVVEKRSENPFAAPAKGEHPTSNIQQPTSKDGEQRTSNPDSIGKR